jgi:hypothetical protein
MKPCPGRVALIEKEGSCNHISCTNCTNDFCWICGGDWNSHENGDACNTSVDFDAAFGETLELAHKDLRKAAGFIGRYLARLQSQRNVARKTD